MHCIKCKKTIPDGSAYCMYCGKSQTAKPKRRARKRPQGSGTIRKDERNKSRPLIAVSPSNKYGRSRVYLGAYATYKDAQEAIEKYTREGRPELYGATLADVYKLWSETHYRNVSQSAVNLYTSMWKRFSDLASIKMEDVRTVHIQEIVDKATSKSAADTIKALASMLCRYAMQNDIISKNYAEFVKIPKFDKKEKIIFSQSQISTLWEHEGDKRVQVILFMIYTGLRIGELAKLTAQDCHLDDGYIICGEKTDAGRNRIVPLPPGIPELSDWLRQWAETAKKKTLVGYCTQRIRDDLFYPALIDLGMIEGTQRATGGFLFPDRNHLTPHSCRHTFASMCAASGMQPEQLQKIIGHASYQTTADIYIHNDLDTLRQAMSKIKR